MKKPLIISALTVLAACTQVNTGQVGIETNFGKVTGQALPPGLHWYMPFVSNIHILNIKIQTVNQNSEAASKDLQTVHTQITLNYHLGAQDPIAHYTRLGDNQEQIEASIVKPAMSEAFKAVIAQYTAEELIAKREMVSNGVIDTLSKRLKQYDLYVDSVSVTNFNFSPAYSKAIEDKQVAEQNASKAKNDLVRIQIETQQKIVEAKGQAEAMSLQKSVVTSELIQLKQMEIQSKMIDKWNGAFPTTYMGSQPPIMLLTPTTH